MVFVICPGLILRRKNIGLRVWEAQARNFKSILGAALPDPCHITAPSGAQGPQGSDFKINGPHTSLRLYLSPPPQVGTGSEILPLFLSLTKGSCLCPHVLPLFLAVL